MAVAMASAVSVLVMDWTTTGASPPMRTTLCPQRTVAQRVDRLGAAPTSEGAPSRTTASFIVGNVLEPVEDQPGLRHPAAVDRIKSSGDEDGQYEDEPAPGPASGFGRHGHFGVAGHGSRAHARCHHNTRWRCGTHR